ncbi:porin family protein [Capnocytophaga sp. ARDL2]|uniref:type IX secretion/gliding motility protein PorT/SprT n=1 Tax=Capnocytophaga sp. ARDL2 TaxID=3238809 RepID=UPI003555FFB1
MKKTIWTLILTVGVFCSMQAQNMFGKNPYKNLQDWDEQQMHYGYFLGFNRYDFKYEYPQSFYDKYGSNQIQVEGDTGFNVGLVGNLRIMEYLDLRFEPGLYYAKRTITYPHINNPIHKVKHLSSTYIHMPLLLKVSTMRTGNIRPYLVGGFSESLNLSARQNSKEDNYTGTFRMKKWTSNYELGFGVDLYFSTFKFSPSIRGVFGMQDEMIRDGNINSIFTGNVDALRTRAVFINFTFH